MAYVLLAGAILAEVTGTIATRYSDGFSRPGPSVVAVAAVALAYYLFSLTLRQGTDIGVAYAIWAALGVGLVAAIGALLLGEGFTAVQTAGLLLVIGGVAALQLGAA